MSQENNTNTQKWFVTPWDGRLANRIAELRKANGLSREKSAAMLTENGYKVSSGQIWGWENSRLPPICHISPISRLFRMTPAELVKNTEIDSEYQLVARIQRSTGPTIQNANDLLTEMIELGAYDECPTRIPPTKTHLRKFAALHGYGDLKSCPLNLFAKPIKKLHKIIDESAAVTSIHDLRNFKNNVSYFVREASLRNLLQPDELIYDDKDARKNKDYPTIKGTNLFLRYKLTHLEIEQIPQFTAQLEDFRAYSDDPTRAPRNIQKRPVTIDWYIRSFMTLAGIFVHFLGTELSEISLEYLVAPSNVRKFVRWWIAKTKEKQINFYKGLDPEKCTGITQTLYTYLIRLSVTAKHYLNDPETCRIIREEIMGYLPHPQSMKVKESRMATLPEIERIGKSIYPFNAKRLAQSRHIRSTLQHMLAFLNDSAKDKLSGSFGFNGNVKFRGTMWALRVGISVMIRLLVRLPIRLRNIKEMEIGKNLFKRDGKFVIRFTGRQLKVEQLGGRTKRIEYVIERDKTGFYELLDEWLTLWRPFLIIIGTMRGKGSSAKQTRDVIQQIRDLNAKPPSDEILNCGSFASVFVNLLGKPVSSAFVYHKITRYTFRFGGKSINPHLFRDCWATNYLRNTRNKYGSCDIVGAAWMLGNSIEMIEKHYAHILDESTGNRPRKWLLERLTEDPDAPDEES